MEKESVATANRRRVPRREFKAAVGVLSKGLYGIEQSYQLGEGGMMISMNQPVEAGSQLVCTFFLQWNKAVIVRGVVRSINPAEGDLPARYGVEFLNLGFQFKREIRTFVAAATKVAAAPKADFKAKR